MRNRSVSALSACVGRLAEVGGDRTDGDTDDRRQERDDQTDRERDPSRVHDLRELVAAEVVGAEPVLRARDLRRCGGDPARPACTARATAHRSTPIIRIASTAIDTSANLCRKNRRRNSCQFVRVTGAVPGTRSGSSQRLGEHRGRELTTAGSAGRARRRPRRRARFAAITAIAPTKNHASRNGASPAVQRVEERLAHAR